MEHSVNHAGEGQEAGLRLDALMKMSNQQRAPLSAAFPDPAAICLPCLPDGMRKRQKNYFGRRAELLAATRRQIARVGYLDVTVRSVADEAECAVQTIYNIFESRSELLSEAVLEYIAAMFLAANDRSQGRDHFLKLSMTFAECAKRYPSYMRGATLMYFPPHPQLYHQIQNLSVKMMRIWTSRELDEFPQMHNGVDLCPQINSVLAMVMLEWALEILPTNDLHHALDAAVRPLRTIY